jgi:hypothetical protein
LAMGGHGEFEEDHLLSPLLKLYASTLTRPRILSH